MGWDYYCVGLILCGIIHVYDYDSLNYFPLSACDEMLLVKYKSTFII